MQTRQSLVKGDRPWCPVDPKHPIHRHAKYDRYANCQELTKSKWIPRFLCRPCRHTISVLPDDTLPYRAISAPLTEASFDAKAAGKPEPPVSERERGYLKRAWARLRQRVEVLLAVLPRKLYTDQGKPFVNAHTRIVCAQLGIRLLHCKPYHSWSKGKIERVIFSLQQGFES